MKSKDLFWDMLILDKVRALLGGRVKVLVAGSAPMSGKVLTFFKCALGCPVSNPPFIIPIKSDLQNR